MMTMIDGDLIKLTKEGCFDLIAHGCNCFNNMNAGIAKSIRLEFPEVSLVDNLTSRGDRTKLGTYSKTTIYTKYKSHISHPVIILNAYIQYYYGRGKCQLDYKALLSFLNKIASDFPTDLKIGMPKIGCGLAGGDWLLVQEMIESTLINHDVTIVNFTG
jgi:O-acetyl-ADP-ribose deacetylase (regulator of RNase III)